MKIDLKDLKKRNRYQYDYMFNGGEWVRKNKYRWVKFRPNSIPIWSNLYWQPTNKGYGYKYPVNYILEGLRLKKGI